MDWQYTPYTVPLYGTALVSLIVVAYLWSRRRATGTLPYLLLMLATAEWSFIYSLELGSTTLARQIFWGKLEYLGVVAVPAMWFVFACQYTGRKKWITRRTLLLLSIEPVLLLALLWTNELHGLVWSSTILNTRDSLVFMEVSHGAAFWAHTVYSYLVFLVGWYLLFQSLLREKTIYRAQILALLVAGSTPWLANILSIFGVSPTLDLTPFAFTITGLATGWGLFRYQLLDLSPLARDTVIESMGDALIALDKQMRVVDLNPAACAVLTRTASEAIGHPILQLLPEYAALIEQYRDTPEAHTEITLGAPPSQQSFDLRISPVRDRQGNLAGRVIILHDITARKKTEDALQNANRVLEQRTRQLEVATASAEQASRLKSEFLSTVSHEIRTPLNAILGFTDLLLTDKFGPLTPTQKSFLERIAGNNRRLLDLINDVLDLSRIEAGRLELDATPYSPREMLIQVGVQTSSLFTSKALTFDLDLDPSLPSVVVGDPDRVQQIVVNLLSNAAKFTARGRVALKAFAPDSRTWHIEVSDTGPGIAPDQQELIFEPFRQIDGSSTREFAGSGLGLSIVRQLCQLMKGTIRVESILGQGSTFIVTLPIQLLALEVISETTKPS